MAAAAFDRLQRFIVFAGLEVRVQQWTADLRSWAFIHHVLAKRPIGKKSPSATAATRLVAFLVTLFFATAFTIEADEVESVPPARFAFAWVAGIAPFVARSRAGVIMRHGNRNVHATRSQQECKPTQYVPDRSHGNSSYAFRRAGGALDNTAFIDFTGRGSFVKHSKSANRMESNCIRSPQTFAILPCLE